MHICVSKLSIIGSDNGLSPGRRQAIIWTNAGILLIGTLGTNFSEILREIHSFSFKKMHLKMSSAGGRLFSLGLNELFTPHMKYNISWNWHTGINVFFLDPYLCLENIWKEKTLVYVLKKPNSKTSEVACGIFGLTASILWSSINWLAPFVAMGLLYLSNSSYYDTDSFLRNLTIHSCPHFNGDLAKPPLKLGHGLVINTPSI